MAHRPTRAATIALAAAAAVLPAAPARAVPPLVVVGEGTILPGLYATPPTTPPYPAQSLSYTGWATDGLTTYACSFTGFGAVTTPGANAGSMSGSCGPYVYPSCSYVLTLATWTFTCGNTGGAFEVRPANVNPTTAFLSTGTIG